MPVTESTRRTFLASLLAAPALALTSTVASRALAQGSRTYEGRGLVTAIRAGQSSITIRHEAIPDLMGAMTMPFNVASASVLNGVSVGDQISFTLGRVDGRLVIQSIRSV